MRKEKSFQLVETWQMRDAYMAIAQIDRLFADGGAVFLLAIQWLANWA